MAGKISVNQVQLGDSGTATNNFVWQTNVDGTCKLARGNAGETTQDILTVDADGRISQGVRMSTVKLHTAGGFGATNTAIRRFASTQISTGSDVSYVDSADLGASFTIQKAGVYAISYSDCFTAQAYMGVSINSTLLTAPINAIPMPNVLILVATSGANLPGCCSVTSYLDLGAVVRPHCSPGLAAGSGANPIFTIQRVS